MRLELHVEMISRAVVLVGLFVVLSRRARLGGQPQMVLNHEAAVAVFAVRAPAVKHIGIVSFLNMVKQTHRNMVKIKNS